MIGSSYRRNQGLHVMLVREMSLLEAALTKRSRYLNVWRSIAEICNSLPCLVASKIQKAD